MMSAARHKLLAETLQPRACPREAYAVACDTIHVAAFRNRRPLMRSSPRILCIALVSLLAGRAIAQSSNAPQPSADELQRANALFAAVNWSATLDAYTS